MPATRFFGPLVSLRGDERGVSIIEFGMFLPFLFLMVMGLIDLGRGFAAKFNLEQSVQRIAEVAAAGAAQNDYSGLGAEAATAAGVPVANGSVEQWLECTTAAGVTTPNASFTGTCPAGSMSSRFVTIRLFGDFEPNFSYGPLGRTFVGVQANGTIRLRTDATVRIQ